MPVISTQIDQYSAQLTKEREEAHRERNLAEQVKYETAQLVVQRKQLIPDLLDITIGFCSNRRNRMTRPFVAWYDFATRTRVVVETDMVSFTLIPWSAFIDNQNVVEQYRCKRRLRDALVTYINELRDRDYTQSLLLMLQSVGLAAHMKSKKVTADKLRDYVAAHSAFSEAEPAEFLESDNEA